MELRHERHVIWSRCMLWRVTWRDAAWVYKYRCKQDHIHVKYPLMFSTCKNFDRNDEDGLQNLYFYDLIIERYFYDKLFLLK